MKLLNIIVNSKKEEESSSRKVGRRLVHLFLEKNPEFELEEINLYEDNIPRLDYKYFSSRCCVVEKSDKLTEEENNNIDRINELCTQFKEADVYVIVAPLWNMSCPAPLKDYIEAVVLQDKTIKIDKEGVKGLLDDKPRTMVYVQASGGPVPWLLKGKVSQGSEYVHDLMKVLGIKKFKELFIENTGFTVTNSL